MGDWKREEFAGKMNIIHLSKRQEHNGESVMPFNGPSFVLKEKHGLFQ
jgi:hypothetical protein